MDTTEIRAFFDGLNHDYLAVHRRKEDLFWSTHMATSDDHAGFAEAELAFKSFVSDPARLAAVRDRVAALEAGSASGRGRRATRSPSSSRDCGAGAPSSRPT